MPGGEARMQIIPSRYLDDGKGYNQGQAAQLIAIEQTSDYDTLLGNILRTGYYDQHYFEVHSGISRAFRVPHFWLLAQACRALDPGQTLDVGCGRGDLLSFLHPTGTAVAGMDFSEDIQRTAWPELHGQLYTGDIREGCAMLSRSGRRFDLVLGTDIWEHLHPDALGGYLDSVCGLGSDDAVFFFVVPAFGHDRVFGELFPLEFGENREDFDARRPFRYLLAEKVDPAIPASGHLIWAHTEWWEARFAERGLFRDVAAEKAFHRAFDDCLPASVRAVYLLTRGPGATSRLRAAERRWSAPTHRARLLAQLGAEPRSATPEVLERGP
jgi:SAM-dependent methyltransferase